MDIEPKVDRGRDLVDVLSAGALGADCAELDFARGNGYLIGYFQQLVNAALIV